MPRSRHAKDSSSGAHCICSLRRCCHPHSCASHRTHLEAVASVSREAEERRRKAELRAKRADDENKRKVSIGTLLW